MSAFGRAFALGVEEELIVVDAATLALKHGSAEVLGAIDVPAGSGSAHPDTYAALVEVASPVARTPEDGVRAVAELRARALAAAAGAGSGLIGAGIHPDGAWGDVVHVDEPRYHEIHAQLRGLLRRTPTCALHVHVGMPDEATAIHVYNGLREWLPLLQALAANSPFWHGVDSGLATSRAQLFRGYPRSEIPRAFSSFDDFESSVASVVAAGDAPDYTFLWWDIRPHPRLGTVEVRAMDAQSSLDTVLGLVALVHGLALAAEDARVPAGGWTPREALMESSFRAARDGLAATLLHNGTRRPVREIAQDAVARAAAAGGDAFALEEVTRILQLGNGADRQRAAFTSGGMPALLHHLAAETATNPYI
ncbi:carboxylate-amine ligase [Conexibacter woesei]|uniref:carboxylate-amine ligase n=1 Tax=Conexibacter woesei TaxID=191495 RepID=UPI0003FE3B47|nr:YbdK family carboxylate-amine ligase [Conexibacter woesei]